MEFMNCVVPLQEAYSHHAEAEAGNMQSMQEFCRLVLKGQPLAPVERVSISDKLVLLPGGQWKEYYSKYFNVLDICIS
jgi:hypothetical protein